MTGDDRCPKCGKPTLYGRHTNNARCGRSAPPTSPAWSAVVRKLREQARPNREEDEEVWL